MKKLFLLILICACTESYSQHVDYPDKKQSGSKNNFSFFPIDSNTKLITYSEVVYLNDSISKGELFSRAKSAFAEIYKSSNVILNEDNVAGVITGQGAIGEFVTFAGARRDAGVVYYKITLSCKNGRYRFMLTNLVLHENEKISINLEQQKKPDDMSNAQWKELRADIKEQMKDLIASIKTEMNKPSAQYDTW